MDCLSLFDFRLDGLATVQGYFDFGGSDQSEPYFFGSWMIRPSLFLSVYQLVKKFDSICHVVHSSIFI